METIPLLGPYALRRLRAEDAPDIFTARSTRSAAHLGPLAPVRGRRRTAIEQTRRGGRRHAGRPGQPGLHAARRGCLRGAYRVQIGGQPPPSPSRSATGFAPNTRDRGLMTAAARSALPTWPSGKWACENVEIKCAAGNLRSNRIPLRLGFRLAPHRSTRRAARRRGVHRPQRIPAATPLKQNKTGKAVPPGSNSRQHPRAAGTASSQSRPGATYRDYPSLIEAISWAGVACR